MSALSSSLFKDYQLNFVPDDGFGKHLVEAYHNKEGHIANLEWDKETGAIGNVDVAEPHQRKGLATAMFNFANTLGVTKPQHTQVLSQSGKAWKESLQ